MVEQRLADPATLETLHRVVYSEEVEWYMAKLEKVKPLSARILGKGNWGRVFGDGNYIDSTIPETQKPAAYAVMDLLNGKKGARILHHASSYGLGMKIIAEAGYRDIRGIDLDKAAVGFCTSHGLRANVMDASQTTFPNDSFDIAVSRDFVCAGYFPPEMCVKLLDEQHRILKPGGFAVFTTMWPGIKHNLPALEEIARSHFRGSRRIETAIPLRVPSGTDLGVEGRVMEYAILCIQKAKA